MKSEKASKKSKQVVQTKPAAQSIKIQAAGNLVLALNFSAPSSRKAPFSNYPLNTVIVVPASSSNLVHFLGTYSCVQLASVKFVYGESGVVPREEAFALFEFIEKSGSNRESNGQIEWSLPLQLEPVNHNGQQRLRPEECVQMVSSGVFKLPQDVRRKYLQWSLECLIIISNVKFDFSKHGRILTSVTASPRVVDSLTASVLVVCHTAGGCPCATSLQLPKREALSMKPVLEAIAHVRKLEHQRESKVFLLCSFLKDFPGKTFSATCLSSPSPGYLTSPQPKLQYHEDIQGVRPNERIDEKEVVAQIDIGEFNAFDFCGAFVDDFLFLSCFFCSFFILNFLFQFLFT